MAMAGNSTNATYYGIANGKIFQSFKTPQTGSKERVNKNGKTVHEIFYDHLEGLIVDISIKDTQEYGKFWMVTLENGEERGILQFNYSSGYANGFLKALPNVNLKEMVMIIPSTKEENKKVKTTVFLTQHGKPCKWYYTKDNLNGLPPLVKLTVKGKEQWDDTDAMRFLEKMVKERIIPALPKGGKTVTEKTPVLAGDDEPEVDPNDLPF